MDDLAKINFIYGSNGTGKTTISRIVADSKPYPQCFVTWQNEASLDTFVYNRDFVDENLNQPRDLRGIFTLGEKHKEIFERMEVGKKELEDINRSITTLKVTLEGADGNGGEVKKMNELEDKFAEVCWELKLKYDTRFHIAFAGVRHSKRAFKDKLLKESSTNSGILLSLEDLEKRAETVFSETPQSENILVVPNPERLLAHESNAILKKKVLGKLDVDVAEVINRLGNSDWVKEGREYYDPNERICPFCQQDTSANLEKSLNDYFDESFRTDSEAIERLQSEYKADSEYLQSGLQTLLNDPSKRLDVEGLQNQTSVIDSRIKLNLHRIEEKRREASNVVELECLRESLDSIRNILNGANAAIQAHNKLVENIHGERTALTEQVWRYVLDQEISDALASYVRKKTGIKAAVASLEEKMANKTKEKLRKEQEIRELEKGTTSIQPTVDDINAILRSFGFLGFTLAQSERPGFYKIQRTDGTDAKETLSEGEGSFIAFLYFYHLIKGSASESGTTSDRVVVFDDPVSSLDSNVLFVVSILIKELFKELRDNDSNIKQIFVLTHNAYFHKEVCFNSRRQGEGRFKDERFWTVRKVNRLSKIESHDTNPIRSTYEWLWREVRKSDYSSPTLPNTMRRILEHYFKFLGNHNSDNIISEFVGQDKLICKSLFSWVNEGSHSVHDDPGYSPNESEVEMYLGVFKQIFEKTGNTVHYEMMMRTVRIEPLDAVSMYSETHMGAMVCGLRTGYSVSDPSDQTP